MARQYYIKVLIEEMVVELIKLGVVGVFILIIFNLGTDLMHLSSSRGGVDDQQKSAKMLRALTWRIALSVCLFLLILLAWWTGLIHPHPVGG